MLKRILIAALMWPLLALAQSYPSPTFNNLTVNGTFTATGKVGLASLASQAANTVVANVTASSASPTALAMPGCNSSTSALQWTSGTGFTCLTTAANLTGASFTGNVNITTSGQTNTLRITDTGASGANIELTGNGATTPTKFIRVNSGALQVVDNAYGAAIFNLDDSGNATFTGGVIGTSGSFTTLAASSTVSGTGFSTYLASPPAIGTTTPAAGKFTTLQATSTITPSTTAGIIGTTAADNANAGSVGEAITSSVAVGSAVALTTNTPANITSISLTAGDWDVSGLVATNPAGSTTQSNLGAAINTTSATFPTAGTAGWTQWPFSVAAGNAEFVPVGPVRINVSTTTTVYLIAQSVFAASTNAAYGTIYARRRR